MLFSSSVPPGMWRSKEPIETRLRLTFGNFNAKPLGLPGKANDCGVSVSQMVCTSPSPS